MGQAIRTRHIPAKGPGVPSYIKAECAAGATRIPIDCSITDEANHRKAACALAKKFGWDVTDHAFKWGVFNNDWYWV